jgi:hypothetical protein
MYYPLQNRKRPTKMLSSRQYKGTSPHGSSTNRSYMPSSGPTRHQRARIQNRAVLMSDCHYLPPISSAAISHCSNPFNGFDSYIKYRDVANALGDKQQYKHLALGDKLAVNTKLFNSIKNVVSDRNKVAFVMNALSILHSSPPKLKHYT